MSVVFRNGKSVVELLQRFAAFLTEGCGGACFHLQPVKRVTAETLGAQEKITVNEANSPFYACTEVNT